MNEIPEEVMKDIKEFEQSESNRKKQTSELVNFNTLSFDDYTANEWELLGVKYVNCLSGKSPAWQKFTLVNAGRRTQKVKMRILVGTLGNEILKENIIERYSKLPEGARYQSKHGVWKLFNNNELKSFVKKIIINKFEENNIEWDIKTSNAVAEYVYAKALQEDVSTIPFDESNPNLVAFKNGTYNFKTEQLEPHKASNMLVNYHDYDLDMSGEPTPHTDKLLAGMMTKDVVPMFKQYLGYMFYHSHEPIQDTVFLHGNGGEGKSTLLNYIIHDILGINNVSTVKPKELAGDNRFKMIQLYQKEANIVADIEKGYLQNTDVLRSLTGGDGADAEAKGVQGISFTNYAKLLFSANELPTFSDNSTGFKDRLMVIELVNGDTRQPDNHFWDNQDMKAVKEERNRFVYACLRAFKVALDNRRFEKPKSVIEASEQWHKSNDHFGEFIDEWCEIDLTSDKGEKASYVVSAYKEFCHMNNYSDKTTAQTITANLKRLGIKKIKNRKGWSTTEQPVHRYIGLKLKEND